MKWKLVGSLGAAVAALGAAALAFGGRATHEVGGQRFAVPKERLFEATIPWLPGPEADSFTFLLEPNSDPDKIPPHRVLVEPAERVCGSDRMAQIVRVACRREETLLRVGPPYKKVFPHPDYPYSWDYYAVSIPAAAGGEPEQLQVAYCSPISPNPARPKGTAICNSIWGVDGLVLSLGFEEHELAELPSMRSRATQMLLSWKVR